MNELQDNVFRATTIAMGLFLFTHLMFFIVSFIPPLDYLQLVLFTLPVPIVLGLTPFGLPWRLIQNGKFYMTGRLAGIGTLGGFIGSIYLSAVLQPSESYIVRMTIWNALQIFSGLLVQGALVLMGILWSRSWRQLKRFWN